jgi:hypothetical protein
MDYQEALAIMEETVSHRVRQLEERAPTRRNIRGTEGNETACRASA